MLKAPKLCLVCKLVPPATSEYPSIVPIFCEGCEQVLLKEVEKNEAFESMRYVEMANVIGPLMMEIRNV